MSAAAGIARGRSSETMKRPRWSNMSTAAAPVRGKTLTRRPGLGEWLRPTCTARDCAHPSQLAGVEFPPDPARAPLRPTRALVAQVSGAPASSAIHVPVYTPHMRTALPSRAGAGRESTGRRIHASQALRLPPRRGEAKPYPLHPRCLCVDTHNACRTGHVSLTLPPLISPPTRKREDAGRVTGFA